MIEELDKLVESMRADLIKFENGNKSAGTRARQVLQEIKKECQVMRVAIQDTIKSV